MNEREMEDALQNMKKELQQLKNEVEKIFPSLKSVNNKDGRKW